MSETGDDGWLTRLADASLSAAEAKFGGEWPPVGPDPRQAILDDPLFKEFAADVTNRLKRLEAAGQMPEAVCVREGLWPGLVTWNGYPVVRLVARSERAWGVLA